MNVVNFAVDVIERSNTVPVLVDFWAEWCGPCKMLTPVLEKLASSAHGAWELVKINTDEHRDLSAEYGIRSIPNVKLFSGGKVTGEFMGALPEQAVADWLKKNLPNKYSATINFLKSNLASISDLEVLSAVSSILAEEPNNAEALLLKARTIVFSEPANAEEILQSLPFSSDYKETADAIFYLAHLLKRTEFPVNEIYIQAINALRGKDFPAALEHFIEVIKEDRKLDNDGARKVCVAIFKYLGEEHPVTIKFRRPFGSALYI